MAVEIDQRNGQFHYVPGFIARRFPMVAALEDNPVFLREAGKRYVIENMRWEQVEDRFLGLLSRVVDGEDEAGASSVGGHG